MDRAQHLREQKPVRRARAQVEQAISGTSRHPDKAAR
jgi:hypothetical protein